jgi:undecaprenyl phosphate-alpha-L-ara4FN deformylase
MMANGKIIALKIDVDTYWGTQRGVPNLIELLQRHHANATFLFSLGPDHTGRAIKKVFRPGFFSKVSRTSVVEHYGIKTLLYGTLLPSPMIGATCADILRQTHAAGFEVGIHTWNHFAWQERIACHDAHGMAQALSTKQQHWTRKQFQAATDCFERIFGMKAATFGAAGWQMNDRVFQLQAEYGMRYASDGRAATNATGCSLATPFFPHIAGQTLSTMQLPTTLPTLDEVLGVGQWSSDNVHDHFLNLTAHDVRDHVFTLHAELEGQKLSPVFERLLAGWNAQGYRMVSMADYYAQLDLTRIPACTVHYDSVPHRSGRLMMQGQPVTSL